MWPIVGGLFLEARQQFSLLGVELLCRQYAGVAELTKLGKLLVNVRLTRGSGLFSRWTVCHRAGKTLPDGVCDVLPVGLVHASDLSLVAGGEDCQGSRQHAGTRTADILAMPFVYGDIVTRASVLLSLGVTVTGAGARK